MYEFGYEHYSHNKSKRKYGKWDSLGLGAQTGQVLDLKTDAGGMFLP
jgi:hypothetical protein